MKVDLGTLRGLVSRCTIREFDVTDIPALVKSANNAKIADQLRDRFPHPYTPADASGWMEHVRMQDPVASFAIAADDELIGGIGLKLHSDVHCRAAELGYWLAEPWWGHGIATRAVTAFTGFAFVHYDLIRIFACVFETNPASARVLEKAGFRLEGRLRMSVVKHGRLLDQDLYSKLSPGDRHPFGESETG